jgi:thioredoxin reductase
MALHLCILNPTSQDLIQNRPKAHCRIGSTIEEILKRDNNVIKVERCNITKGNDDKKNILYHIFLIKLKKPLSSLNKMAFSHLELLYSKI